MLAVFKSLCIILLANKSKKPYNILIKIKKECYSNNCVSFIKCYKVPCSQYSKIK